MLTIKQDDLVFITMVLLHDLNTYNTGNEILTDFYNFLADAINEDKKIITIGIKKEGV